MEDPRWCESANEATQALQWYLYFLRTPGVDSLRNLFYQQGGNNTGTRWNIRIRIVTDGFHQQRHPFDRSGFQGFIATKSDLTEMLI